MSTMEASNHNTCNGLVATPTLAQEINGVWYFYGTAGPDVILGTPGDDVIKGFGGDDTICGFDGP